jgi:hypothetical protein
MTNLQAQPINLTLQVEHWTGFKSTQAFINVFKKLDKTTKIGIINALKAGKDSGYCLLLPDGRIIDLTGTYAGVYHYMIACKNLANKKKTGAQFEIDGMPVTQHINKTYKRDGWAKRKLAQIKSGYSKSFKFV